MSYSKFFTILAATNVIRDVVLNEKQERGNTINYEKNNSYNNHFKFYYIVQQ